MRTDKTNISERVGLRLRILSDDQIKEIHSRSLEILNRTGVYVESDEAIRMLEDAGCRVQDGVVKFPPGLVEWALDAAPSQFLFYDRTGDRALNVGGHNTYFGMGPTLLYMLDPETGERRKFLKSDTEKAARVADALETLDGGRAEEWAADIAHHLFQAGAAADPVRTARFLRLAGDAAMATAGFEQAARLYGDALELAGEGDRRERAELLFRHGLAVRSVSGWSAVVTVMR